MPWPSSRMDLWYRDARQGLWRELRAEWEDLAEAISEPETGALIRFDNPSDDSFGVGVMVDARSFLTVRHHGRLVVGPASACGNLRLYRLR
jgi:hypothetical protein